MFLGRAIPWRMRTFETCPKLENNTIILSLIKHLWKTYLSGTTHPIHSTRNTSFTSYRIANKCSSISEKCNHFGLMALVRDVFAILYRISFYLIFFPPFGCSCLPISSASLSLSQNTSLSSNTSTSVRPPKLKFINET